MMFGDKLKYARKQKDLTMDELSAKYNLRYGAGLNKGTLSKYENNKQEPMITVVRNLAELLDVSVDYLLENSTGEPQKAPALNEKDERDIAKQLEKLRKSLEEGEGLMFDGDPLSDEARESVLSAMKLGLEAAKLKNKEKYTPKKYKEGR